MMQCIHCGHTQIHLCAGKIKAYNDSFTPEEHAQRHAKRMELLDRAIAAGKELKEKYGIELVCSVSQKRLDYLEATDLTDVTENLDTDLSR